MRSSYWAIVGALMLVEVAAIFETSMIYVALPLLIREFGDPITAGWIVTVHTLIGASAALMIGRLGDIYGRKRVQLIILAIAVLGSLISAATSNYAMVLVGRALQGVVTALIPLSVGIMRETIAKQKVPVAIGFMSAGMSIGSLLGAGLAGWVIDHYPWHALFLLSGSMLVIAFIATMVLVPSRPGNPPRVPIDWVEGILPIPGITSLLLAISLSNARGWTDPIVLGLVVVAIVIMVYWVRRSLGAKEPFIDLRALATRNVAVASAIAFLLSLGTMQIMLVFSAYNQNPLWTMAGLGMTATAAGLAKIPSNFLSLGAGPLAGWIQQKWTVRQPILWGGTLATVGWLLGMLFPSTLMQVILLLCVISFGTSILNAALPNVIVASVAQERTGESVGALLVWRNMGLAVGAQIIAVMLASDAVSNTPGGPMLPSPFGFKVTMGAIAMFTLIATLAAFLLRRTDEREETTALRPAAAGSAGAATAPRPR